MFSVLRGMITIKLKSNSFCLIVGAVAAIAANPLSVPMLLLVVTNTLKIILHDKTVRNHDNNLSNNNHS